jgi:hypothetical protein
MQTNHEPKVVDLSILAAVAHSYGIWFGAPGACHPFLLTVWATVSCSRGIFGKALIRSISRKSSATFPFVTRRTQKSPNRQVE